MFRPLGGATRRWIQAAAGAIGLAAFTLSAAAGVALTSASPSTFSREGDVITYTFTISGEDTEVTGVTTLAMILPVGAINCVGLPLAAFGTTTCTAQYVVTEDDIVYARNQDELRPGSGGIPQQAGSNPSYTLTTVDGPRSGSVTGSINTGYINPEWPYIGIDDVVCQEGDSGTTTCTLIVNLSQPAPHGGVMLGMSTADGTATHASGDYVDTPGGGMVFAGQSSLIFDVEVNGDNIDEADETFFVNILYWNNAYIRDSQAKVTIPNDDANPPSLSIRDADVQEGNAGTTSLIFTVSLNGPAGPGGVTFNYATEAGTATADVDYTTTSGSGSIAPGSRSTTITVPVTGDIELEDRETFFVNVTNTTNAAIADGQGLGMIFNDDAHPHISINDVSQNEGNAGGERNLDFTVTLSKPSYQTITVNYATTPGTAESEGVGFGGEPAGDFMTTTGTLTFAPGETSKTISVPIIGDPYVERHESFTVNLSNPTYTQINDGQGKGTIQNDDRPQANTIYVNLWANTTSTVPLEICCSEDRSGIRVFVETQPSNGVATEVEGQAITYTPNAGYSGPDSFTYFAVAEGEDEQGVRPLESSRATVFIGVLPPVTITPADLALPGATAGVAYSQQLTAAGGTAPYAWSVSAPALPDGLTLDPTTGLISGTPTRVGTFAFNVTATASDGTATKGYTIDVTAPTLVPTPAASTNLGTGRIGQAFSANVSASGGTAPYSYAIDVNPPGLSINASTGEISGSPLAAGTYNFSVTMTDSSTGTGSPFSIVVPYAVTILDNVTVTNGSPLPGGQVGAAYNQTITASGGNGPPYTFAVTGGALPGGLTLAANGALIGTPWAGGPSSFTVTATDPGGFSGSKVLALNIGAPTITIAPTTLPNATVGVAFSQAITVSGGTAPYSVTLTGTLPAGVTFTGGTLSGTPTQGGIFNFTVFADDSSAGAGPYSASRAYTWTVQGPTMSMTPAAGALPGGQQGVAYSQSFAAAGGTAPYTYTVFSGTLPAGLTLSSGGVLSGTPTDFGAFSFAIRATDSSTGTGPYTVTNAYTLNVQQAVPTITSVTPANGTTAGGTVVTITGTNFLNVSAVTFGGTAATGYTVNNATTITATTPARAAGAVAVAVTTPGGTATLTNGYTYVAPGSVRFDITSDEDGSFVFTSATAGLNFTVNTVGGSGSSPTVTLQPGNYALAFTTPAGFGLASASCTPSTSTVSTSAKTAALVVASNVTTVCTIQSVASRQAAVEAITTALDTSSRLIIANAPNVGRRLDRLNGGGASDGSASAFGKTFASNLPFSAAIGADELRFAMSLSGLRAQRSAATFSAPANENAVPAALSASVEPGSALAATDAAAATAAITERKGPRFDVWVEGLIAQFDAAASSDGSFMILHAGADYLVTDNLLLGVSVQGDWLNMDTATGSLDSNGWLAGPYLTARLAENLYLDARAAWGGASFDVSPFNTYTDTVDSDRELYTAALIGEFKLGELLTVRPEGRVTWYKETTDSYIDSLSVFIPSVEITTGEATFGPDFEWTLTRENGGVLSPRIGFDLIWTFKQDNTATAFTNAPGLNDTGVRGRIEAGLTYINPEGITLGADLFYDGIGGGDYQSWGGTLKLRFGF